MSVEPALLTGAAAPSHAGPSPVARLARDYPTIQAVILLFSLVYVLINLAVDLTYTLFDPRIRY